MCRPADLRSRLSLVLVALGAIGVWTGKLLLPGRRTSGPSGIEMSPGITAWLMYGAMTCACLVMLSVVVDHYDRRDNETSYRRFARTFRIVGWALFAVALLLHAFGVGS